MAVSAFDTQPLPLIYRGLSSPGRRALCLGVGKLGVEDF